MRFIQLWIMPARRGLPPSVEQRQYTVEDRHNRLLQVLRPDGADALGLTVHQDASMHVARLDSGVNVERLVREGHGGYLYLIEGDLELNGEGLTRGDAAKVLGGGLLSIRVGSLSELLLVESPL